MEWKEVRLGDVCDLVAGYAFKAKDFGDFPHKVIKIGDINPPFVNYESELGVNLENYDTRKLEKYLVRYDDFVLAMTGATIGKVGRYVAQEPSYLNQRVLLFKAKENVCSKLLYYIVTSPIFAKYVVNHIDSESAQPNISAGTISKYELQIPSSIDDQRRISSILSSLDRKIELNNKINATLEEMAQALFKSWFVDFEPFKNGKFIETEIGKIPEGWRVGTLSEVAENITDGVHNTVKDDPDGTCLLLSAKNIKNGVLSVNSQERTISVETFQKLRKRTRLAKGDVLITTVGTIGELLYLHDDLNNIEFQRSVGIIKPLQIEFSYYIYLLLKAQISKVKHMAHGAVQQCIFIGDLKSYEVVVPATESVIEFSKNVEAIFNNISNNNKQSSTLTHLRDTLLPRLMSGEIEL